MVLSSNEDLPSLERSPVSPRIEKNTFVTLTPSSGHGSSSIPTTGAGADFEGMSSSDSDASSSYSSQQLMANVASNRQSVSRESAIKKSPRLIRGPFSMLFLFLSINK